jgi:hypothetical protein
MWPLFSMFHPDIGRVETNDRLSLESDVSLIERFDNELEQLND